MRLEMFLQRKSTCTLHVRLLSMNKPKILIYDTTGIKLP